MIKIELEQPTRRHLHIMSTNEVREQSDPDYTGTWETAESTAARGTDGYENSTSGYYGHSIETTIREEAEFGVKITTPPDNASDDTATETPNPAYNYLKEGDQISTGALSLREQLGV
ncbi:hypothetical protein U1Q18_047239 [Sarracenia purpurea var. burkii]